MSLIVQITENVRYLIDLLLLNKKCVAVFVGHLCDLGGDLLRRADEPRCRAHRRVGARECAALVEPLAQRLAAELEPHGVRLERHRDGVVAELELVGDVLQVARHQTLSRAVAEAQVHVKCAVADGNFADVLIAVSEFTLR